MAVSRPSRTSDVSGGPKQRALAYGVFPDAINGTELVFVPEQQALELAQVHRALRDAATWGEFRAAISARHWQHVVDEYRDEGNRHQQTETRSTAISCRAMGTATGPDGWHNKCSPGFRRTFRSGSGSSRDRSRQEP
jgi:hypothetical protein